MQHAIEKQAVVSNWSSPASSLKRQKRTSHRPFMIRVKSPRARNVLFARYFTATK
ncbi:hypothetical protein JK222_16470 [Gluconobacter cerinus]|nr:hypothetical protein [Gluconobacter cerinus]